jgi:hypothetical protein
MRSGLKTSIIGAALIAAVSTLGDFMWASQGLHNSPLNGVVHGTLLFACIGLYLGALAKRHAAGMIGGALIGFAAAGGFYVIAPVLGRSAMFVLYFATWIALGVLNENLMRREIRIRSALRRGLLAAVGSGVAFYLVSGIWRPFDPQGWDYLTHFSAWTLAYFPGFAALLMPKTLSKTFAKRSS